MQLCSKHAFDATNMKKHTMMGGTHRQTIAIAIAIVNEQTNKNRKLVGMEYRKRKIGGQNHRKSKIGADGTTQIEQLA